VRVQQQHEAVAQQLGRGVRGQLAQLGLVDHLQPGGVEVLAVGQLEVDVDRLQQAQLDDAPAGHLRLLHLPLELVEEADDLLQHRRRLAVVAQQALALGVVEARVVRIDHHRGRAAVGHRRVIEGVAAQEGRHVARAPAAVGLDEQVLVLAQAEQRHRRDLRGTAAGRWRDRHEGDHELLGDLGEFADGHGGDVLRRHALEAGQRHQALRAVRAAVERHGPAVQVGHAHPSTPVRDSGERASRVSSSRLTSTLSTRLPSRSTTSKRQPLHSTTSAVRGRRPSSNIVMPASVL